MARNGKMNDISIGAVGAAIIAGLVSLLGLVIGKEQKVSEFRQAWINDLRKCIIDYLACINAISDVIRLNKSGKAVDSSALLGNYKNLNEASHGITLRINPDEEPSKALLFQMKEFETLAGQNAKLTPENIKEVEEKFIECSQSLLRFEWRRVKRGERTYYVTKYIVIGMILIMLVAFAYLWQHRSTKTESRNEASFERVTQNVSTEVICNQKDAINPSIHEQRPVKRKRKASTPAVNAPGGQSCASEPSKLAEEPAGSGPL
ncbi:hypothetical protein V7S57_16750 [Caulobacter sp. CCNWLY153]|uniref:hypothetical protein n=1 Tax=unclassified Caulobacter TaxID=2648921 RepID=UPI002FF192AC